jgi:hypothetical protein
VKYNELKEIALKGHVVVLGGSCFDGRHGEPEPDYIIPVYHAEHPDYGECVVVDEEIGVVLTPREDLDDLNEAIGCCCIHTLSKPAENLLEGAVAVDRAKGLSLEEFLEKVRKAW